MRMLGVGGGLCPLEQTAWRAEEKQKSPCWEARSRNGGADVSVGSWRWYRPESSSVSKARSGGWREL